MNKDICRLSSEAVYGGRLKCGNNEVGSQLLAVPSFPSCLPQAVSRAVYSWLKVVIDPQKPVIFVDTDNIKKDPRPVNKLNSVNQGSSEQEGIEALETSIGGRVGGNVVNPTEATLIRFILKGLFTSGVPASSVGVISPFRAQVRMNCSFYFYHCLLSDMNIILARSSESLRTMLPLHRGRKRG
jgi:superfamily I DNA and/or RNA helicase